MAGHINYENPLALKNFEEFQTFNMGSDAVDKYHQGLVSEKYW